MTIGQMFGQSGILALLGMTVVFSFLAILIFVMGLVKRLVAARGWDAAEPTPEAAFAGPVDADTAAAAAAAVSEYRKRQ